MPYLVKVDQPNAGAQDVYIHGLGTFRNGTETEVDDDQIQRFRIAQGTTQSGVFDDDGNVVAPHDENGHAEHRFVLGPPPSKLNIPGITITKKAAESKPAETKQTPAASTSNTGEGASK